MSNPLSSYYFEFDPTGCPEVDAILAAVASAGSGYHNTDGWTEGEPGSTPVDLIQKAANEAAKLRAAPDVHKGTLREARQWAVDGAKKAWALDARQKTPYDTASSLRASVLEEVIAKIDDLLASPHEVEAGWPVPLPIADAPRMRKLIVGYPNRSGKWRWVMATFYEAGSLPMGEDYEDKWAEEGWYEESETHETLCRVDGEPTHFIPLPPAPPLPNDVGGASDED